MPTKPDEKTIKKSKKIINQLKTDIFLKGKVSDVFTWVCGENFDALTHFFGPQAVVSIDFPEDYQCLKVNKNLDKKAEKSLLWAKELCKVASSEVASNATSKLSNLIDIDLTYKTKSGKPRIKIDKPYPALSLNVVDLGFFECENKTTTVYLENLGGGNLNARIKKITVYTPDGSSKQWFKIKMKKIENNL